MGQLVRGMTVVLLALSLVLLGAGHRMGASQISVDLTAYAMPDGTLPELCLDASGEKPARMAPCPACTIAAALHVPDPVLLPPVTLASRLMDWAEPAQVLALAHSPLAPPARGPPLFS